MEEVVILEVRIRVAIHTCGTGGGRLQADELAAAIQDEVAPGENGCMTPHAADPRAEHAKGLLGRFVIVAVHVGHRTIARNESANVIKSSRQLSKTADAEPESRALVLARHRPERQKSRFDRANFVIRSMVVLAVEVLGSLAVIHVHFNCPAIYGLELSWFGAEGNIA